MFWLLKRAKHLGVGSAMHPGGAAPIPHCAIQGMNEGCRPTRAGRSSFAGGAQELPGSGPGGGGESDQPGPGRAPGGGAREAPGEAEVRRHRGRRLHTAASGER